MLLSTASLAAVNRFIAQDLKDKQAELEQMDPPPAPDALAHVEADKENNYADRRRFRANLIVDNGESSDFAFEEDEFKDVKVGGAHFLGGMRCTRCTVPSADPDKGVAVGWTAEDLVCFFD